VEEEVAFHEWPGIKKRPRPYRWGNYDDAAEHYIRFWLPQFDDVVYNGLKRVRFVSVFDVNKSGGISKTIQLTYFLHDWGFNDLVRSIPELAAANGEAAQQPVLLFASRYPQKVPTPQYCHKERTAFELCSPLIDGSNQPCNLGDALKHLNLGVYSFPAFMTSVNQLLADPPPPRKRAIGEPKHQMVGVKIQPFDGEQACLRYQFR
jgi:hypothetical protein